MTDFLKDLVREHFALLFYTALGVFVVILALGLKLFHELREDPERTRKALRIEAGFIERIVGVFRKTPPPPPEKDPLMETIKPQDKE